MITRLKRWLLISITITILILGTSLGWILINKNNTATNPADCAVVFGAAVWRGGIPSHALSDRIMAGIDLYKEKKVSCLIFSGADTEPDVMKQVAIENKISPDQIFLDHQGVNTLATLQNLDKEKTYILTSNDFHLGRIRLLASKINLTSQTHTAPYQHGRYIKEPYFILREILGIIWYTLRVDI